MTDVDSSTDSPPGNAHGGVWRRRAGKAAVVFILFGALLSALWLSGVVTAGRLRSTFAVLLHKFTLGSPQRQSAGASFYDWNCSVCHGLAPAEAGLLARQAFSKFGDFELWRRIRAEPAHEEIRGGLGTESVLDVLSYLHGVRDLHDETAPKARPPLDGAYKYVALAGAVRVYDLDRQYAYVKQIPVAGLAGGIAASAATGRLYVSLGQTGVLVCIDLSTDETLWSREYSPGVDSMALSPDGKTIYMPSGEHVRVQDKGEWLIIDALSGDVRKRVLFGTGPHNSIAGQDGKLVYLAPVATPYLGVLDAATEEIVGKVGPFGQNVRPFAVTSDGAFALVNVDYLSGFEVADLRSGNVIHRVEVEGFPWEEVQGSVQSHGVAFNPDETEAWVSDAFNRHVHVFDVSGLPSRPRQIASVNVTRSDHPETMPKWINFSRDGRYVHVSNGAIIDAKSREIVTWVADTKQFMEIHFEQGRPVAAFSRYGVGYRNAAWGAAGK